MLIWGRAFLTADYFNATTKENRNTFLSILPEIKYYGVIDRLNHNLDYEADSSKSKATTTIKTNHIFY